MAALARLKLPRRFLDCNYGRLLTLSCYLFIMKSYMSTHKKTKKN